VSRISELFLNQYEFFIWADGNNRYLLPKDCWWQMRHTHYPFSLLI